MKQATLDGFVRTQPPRVHFLLTDFEATFEDSEPHGAERIGQVNLKFPGGSSNGVTLQLWKVKDTSGPFCFAPNIEDCSLLVSMLQKAVRRQRTDAAKLTAQELLHLDAGVLVKRLPIIAVEDVQVDRNLTRCVWFMFALLTPKIPYTLTEDDAHWIVGYAESLALCGSSRPWTPGEHPPASMAWQAAAKRIDHVSMALVCRSAFGGLTGDVHMLLRAASSPQNTAPTLAVTRSMPARRLEAKDALPEAVDFHCDPKMVSAIATKFCMDEQTVKDAIWNHSSKTNTRSSSPTPESEEWRTMKEQVRRLQRRRLDRAFARNNNK